MPKTRRLTKAGAQNVFRATWSSYLLSPDTYHAPLEEFMAEVQMQCCDGGRPGPDWHAFIDTLPGYRDFWSRRKKNK